MNDRIVMLDIETTGVNMVKDDVIQIAMVPMSYHPDTHMWFPWPGALFEMELHTNKRPTTPFAKEHMVEAYRRAKLAPKRSPKEVRHAIMHTLDKWGFTRPHIYFAGWNAGLFDISFLVRKGYLIPPGYKAVKGKQVMIGDFHYRVFDLQGALSLAMTVFNVDRDQMRDRLKDMPNTFDMRPFLAACGSKGKKHNALFDCYDQINSMNKLTRLLMAGVDRVTFPAAKR